MNSRKRVFTSEFFPSGDFDGPRRATLTQWNGVAIWGPFGQLDKLLERKELDKPGLYLLRGPAKGSDKLQIYIGETRKLNKRINQHRDKKENWWTEVITISSRLDENFLHDTNRKFLERKLLNEAQEKIVLVKNEKTPDPSDPGDSDKPDVEDFWQGIKDILRLLKIKDFDADGYITGDASRLSVRPYEKFQNFEMTVPTEGGIARAHYNVNTRVFTVRKGSPARKEWAGRQSNASEKRHRDRLFDDGSLEIDSGICRFTRDVEFKSPSAAAGVIAGLSVSGRRYWKMSDDTKQTFGDWERTQREGIRPHEPGKKAQRPRFEMLVPREGGRAIAVYKSDTEFIVLKGSHARSSWKGGDQRSGKRLREDLVKKASLETSRDGVCRFTEDVIFDTPSAAAGIVSGNAVNGLLAWKVRGTSQTFKEWKESQKKETIPDLSRE